MSRSGRVGRWAPLAVVREPGGLIVEEQEREVSLLSVYVLVDGTKRIDRECGKRRSGGRERPNTQRLCRRTTYVLEAKRVVLLKRSGYLSIVLFQRDENNVMRCRCLFTTWEQQSALLLQYCAEQSSHMDVPRHDTTVRILYISSSSHCTLYGAPRYLGRYIF